MKAMQSLLNKQPFAAVVLVIVLVWPLTALAYLPLSLLFESRGMAESWAKLLLCVVMLGLMVKYRVARQAGITATPASWNPNWWKVFLLMVLTVPLYFMLNRIDVGALAITRQNLVAWLLRNFSTGAWEELLFRGLCFYLLYRAWGSTRSGLFRAAIIPALLFGALHLINLPQNGLDLVLFQIPRAALAAVGFAGILAYSRTIWPAVLLHAAINATGSIATFLAGPGYSFPNDSMLINSLKLLVMFLFITLPGLWCLSRAPLFKAEQAPAATGA